ncbi:DUF4360 domain-containing protein [Actinoplanes xinjiangensis]|jgi:hypothetical protein|uniref:Uncharacterized protein DUF4360 n=1 Tax=Actinoplanes xinjiangensis TaxID=512350 RepID=A0A316F508_9ACTN|nr:DUF4360 domain-containing protein [Actinoplanes xinjiangensis]PWK40540.1 uncharacterized protein DUF4360 [Actinoplanes xinjiangensis]GIF42241.1 hypothetical protein Axi01nite_65520 [Actinoplanes xinjiangensis]
MFGTKKAAAILAGALIGPLLPTAAQAAPAPTITLKVMGAFGSGCPKDTTDAQPNEDGTAFSLTYSAFRVYGNDYKNCKMTIRVAAPQGWTYAVTSVINRVTPDLQDKSSAKLQMNAWFTGSPWTASADNSISGPNTSLWTTMSSADTLIYAPCSQSFNLNINNTLRVNGNASSSAELLDTDTQASTIFNLSWKQC